MARNEAKIIDMHTHCLEKPDLATEFSWFDKNYKHKISRHLAYLKKNGIAKALVHILDERASKINCRPYANLALTLLVNFRGAGTIQRVREAKKSGFKGIKILTHEQEVVAEDFQKILKMAQEIERQKMFLVICATFGGIAPYKHDALALASYLLQNGFGADLILAHAGGARAREAALIAEAVPNVYLDTSFTTNYWSGSPVMADLAFAIKKLPGRFFFGSDSPNISFAQAKNDTLAMLKGAPKKIQENVFYSNAFNFLEKYE